LELQISELEQMSSPQSEPPVPAPESVRDESQRPLSEISRSAVPCDDGLARKASEILRQIRHESARVAAKSAQVASKTARKSAQELSKARQEIKNNLKASELKKNYQKVLAFAHARVFDRKLEPLFFIPTHAPGQQPTVAFQRQVSPSAYEGPTPQLVFEWALTSLPQDLREFAFVDFRAGRGRVVLLAARRNFEKVIGYEFDDQTYDDLVMNVAQFPRSQMVCRNVECLRGDREGVCIPDQPVVLFFANAHQDELLPVVLSYAASSHQRNPRSIYLVLLNPGDALPGKASPGEAENVFKSVPWPLIDRVKLAVLSPVQVAVYHAAP
jgi:hypothetical protein